MLFPTATLDAIEQAIKRAELTHAGEVRFAIETSLTPRHILNDITPRAHALEVFSQLRVWDTEANNGVLIYVQLADRNVEIVADRGIDAKVGAAGWQKICAGMETEFKRSNFEGGVIAGIAAVSRELARYFPAQAAGPNELPDAPVVI